MTELPQRKRVRLKGHNYSGAGKFFITLCVKDKHELLGRIVGAGFHARPSDNDCSYVELTELGCEIAKTIEYADKNYKNITIEKYVIMPNHIHMIILLRTGGHGNPPLQAVIGQIKSYSTKRWNEINETNNLSFWQRSYHDHIIHDEIEYQNIWRYIDTNPSNWKGDRYYVIEKHSS